MSCQLALCLSLATARLLVVLTAFPPEVLFSLLLDTTLLVIVLRIGRSPLPVHFALEPTERLCIGSQFLAEHAQAGFSPSWNQRDGRGTQIRSDDLVAHFVLGLVMRHAFQC